VKEFLDPLSRKPVKRPKRLKIFERFSRVEKDLFEEAAEIEAEFEKKNENPNNEILNVYSNNLFVFKLLFIIMIEKFTKYNIV